MMLHRVNDLPLGIVQDLIDDLWIAILDKITCGSQAITCSIVTCLKPFTVDAATFSAPAWAIIRPVYLPEP